MSYYEQKLQQFHLFLFSNYSDLFETFGNRALAVNTTSTGDYALQIAIDEGYYTKDQAKKLHYLWDHFNPFTPFH